MIIKWLYKNVIGKDKNIDPNRFRIIKKKHIDKYNIILDLTSYLNDNASISERIYCIINGLTKNVKCNNINCQNNSKFLSFNLGYQKFCCRNCSHTDKNVKSVISKKIKYNWSLLTNDRIQSSINKRKQTCLKKYGVEHAVQNINIKKKISDSLSKLNISCFNDSNVQLKIRKVFQEKYKSSSPFGSKCIQEKIKKTNLKKYGAQNVFSSTKIKNKIKNTNIKKYGCDNPQKSDNIKQKTQNTCKIKYGGNSSLCSSYIRQKGKQTCLIKYGKTNYNQKHISDKSLALLQNKEWLYKEYINNNKTSKEIAKQLNVYYTTVLSYLHRLEIPIRYENCISSYEKEIREFIKIKNIIFNDRKIIYPNELDIYLPDYKLAIEFNGLYWHSSNNVYSDSNLKNKHAIKTDMCNLKGIQLFHIFENEWINDIKKNIWKSIINDKIGKNICINSKYCNIVEIKNCNDFYNNNHLYGYTNSIINIGLCYNNKLISVMSFRIPRSNCKYQFELSRYSSLINYSIIGGYNKIFNYFINKYKPKSIIAYENRRYGNGDVFYDLGFKYINNTEYNYYYFLPNDLELYYNDKFKKYKLKYFNKDLTKIENIYNNGYRRIWDCGNMVFVWN